jgi:ABC-type transport system substrate-binding protein/DNA-binding SARP family transcriptional activator
VTQRLRFSVLGPLEVCDGDRRLALGGRRSQTLVALLLLTPGEPQRRDVLIDAIWAQSPPRDAEHALDNLVSRVRSVLGADVIRSGPGTYALAVERDSIDSVRFERLSDEGRAALAAGDPARAAALFGEGLRLWRGEPLADLDTAPAVGDFARRLLERRAAVVEDEVDAQLALGAHQELLPKLRSLVAEEPLRDRRRGQLMLALYRAGRQAEALQAYQDAREYLAAELGLEPGRALRDLELAIARHDPALDLPSTASLPTRGDVTGPRPRSRSRRVVLAALGLAAMAASVLVFTGAGDNPGGASLAGNGVMFIGKDGVHAVDTDAAMGAIATLGDAVWGANFATGRVVRVDPHRGAVTQTAHVGDGPSGVAVAGDDVWVADAPRDRVVRVDGASGDVVQRVEVGRSPVAITAGYGSVWVASAGDQTLARIDPGTGRVVAKRDLRAVPGALAAGAGGIWVSEPEARQVVRINPRSQVVDVTVAVGAGPRSLSAANRSVWVANTLDATVSRIDVGHGAVLATTPVGGAPTALLADGKGVWVGVRGTGELLRLEGPAGRVERRRDLPGRPDALARIGGGVAVALSPAPSEHRGGTLRVRTASLVESVDPGDCCVTPSEITSLLYDGLTGIDRSSPTAPGVVADLALALPAPTAGGKVYTFILRPGLRYSTGEPVRASDFRRGFERVLRTTNEGWLSLGILGGSAGCVAGRRCNLRDVVVADDVARKVSIHLSRPDPELLHKLSGHVAAPVPPSTPRRIGVQAIPGTGPYRVARFHVGRTLVLERNPYFREWSPAAQPAPRPERLVFSLGGEPADAAEAVLRGDADVSLDPPSPATLGRLRTERPGQLHVHHRLNTDFQWLNLRAPPFDDARVRRALNLAVDRRAAVAAFGGPGFAFATCQLLPPGVSGYAPYCPYTRRPSRHGVWRAPDLARARRLVAASGTRGMRVTLWSFPDEPSGPTLSRVVVRALTQLGYRARLRVYRDFGMLLKGSAPLQILAADPVFDYPSAARVLGSFQGICQTRGPGGADDRGAPCDPRLLGLIAAAVKRDATDVAAARRLWAAADRRLVDLAALVPLVNEAAIVVTGPQVGNYGWSPAVGALLGQMWLQ